MMPLQQSHHGYPVRHQSADGAVGNNHSKYYKNNGNGSKTRRGGKKQREREQFNAVREQERLAAESVGYTTSSPWSTPAYRRRPHEQDADASAMVRHSGIAMEAVYSSSYGGPSAPGNPFNVGINQAYPLGASLRARKAGASALGRDKIARVKQRSLNGAGLAMGSLGLAPTPTVTRPYSYTGNRRASVSSDVSECNMEHDPTLRGLAASQNAYVRSRSTFLHTGNDASLRRRADSGSYSALQAFGGSVLMDGGLTADQERKLWQAASGERTHEPPAIHCCGKSDFSVDVDEQAAAPHEQSKKPFHQGLATSMTQLSTNVPSDIITGTLASSPRSDSGMCKTNPDQEDGIAPPARMQSTVDQVRERSNSTIAALGNAQSQSPLSPATEIDASRFEKTAFCSENESAAFETGANSEISSEVSDADSCALARPTTPSEHSRRLYPQRAQSQQEMYKDIASPSDRATTWQGTPSPGITSFEPNTGSITAVPKSSRFLSSHSVSDIPAHHHVQHRPDGCGLHMNPKSFKKSAGINPPNHTFLHGTVEAEPEHNEEIFFDSHRVAQMPKKESISTTCTDEDASCGAQVGAIEPKSPRESRFFPDDSGVQVGSFRHAASQGVIDDGIRPRLNVRNSNKALDHAEHFDNVQPAKQGMKEKTEKTSGICEQIGNFSRSLSTMFPGMGLPTKPCWIREKAASKASVSSEPAAAVASSKYDQHDVSSSTSTAFRPKVVTMGSSCDSFVSATSSEDFLRVSSASSMDSVSKAPTTLVRSDTVAIPTPSALCSLLTKNIFSIHVLPIFQRH